MLLLGKFRSEYVVCRIKCLQLLETVNFYFPRQQNFFTRKFACFCRGRNLAKLKAIIYWWIRYGMTVSITTEKFYNSASGALWSICKEVWLISEIFLFVKLGINLISLGTITQIKCKQLFTSMIMLKILN